MDVVNFSLSLGWGGNNWKCFKGQKHPNGKGQKAGANELL